jgi:catechol 2,3-dioxygenase-like lactoylglutathione lyase family enzyme
LSVSKPRLVGLNHIALEVGDVEDALRFYESVHGTLRSLSTLLLELRADAETGLPWGPGLLL